MPVFRGRATPTPKLNWRLRDAADVVVVAWDKSTGQDEFGFAECESSSSIGVSHVGNHANAASGERRKQHWREVWRSWCGCRGWLHSSAYLCWRNARANGWCERFPIDPDCTLSCSIWLPLPVIAMRCVVSLGVSCWLSSSPAPRQRQRHSSNLQVHEQNGANIMPNTVGRRDETPESSLKGAVEGLDAQEIHVLEAGGWRKQAVPGPSFRPQQTAKEYKISFPRSVNNVSQSKGKGCGGRLMCDWAWALVAPQCGEAGLARPDLHATRRKHGTVFSCFGRDVWSDSNKSGSGERWSTSDSEAERGESTDFDSYASALRLLVSRQRTGGLSSRA